MKLVVDFFKSAEGKSPVADYLDELDAKQGGEGALDTLRDQDHPPGAFRLSEKDGGNG
jgi:hypothetical protein